MVVFPEHPPTLSAVPPSRWPLDPSPEPRHGRQRPLHAKATVLSCAVLAAGAFVVSDPLRLHARCLAAVARHHPSVGSAAAASACARDRACRALGALAVLALYAGEAARSSTLRYVADRRSPAQADAFLDALTRAPIGAPRVTFTIENYHYETRSTGAGKSRSTTTVKVVTSRAAEPAAFGAWRDASGDLRAAWRRGGGGGGGRPFTKLRLRKALVFADADAAADFARQRDEFVRRNRADRHHRVGETFAIDGYDADERLLVVPTGREVDATRAPPPAAGAAAHVRPLSFWLATAMLLTVPCVARARARLAGVAPPVPSPSDRSVIPAPARPARSRHTTRRRAAATGVGLSAGAPCARSPSSASSAGCRASTARSSTSSTPTATGASRRRSFSRRRSAPTRRARARASWRARRSRPRRGAVRARVKDSRPGRYQSHSDAITTARTPRTPEVPHKKSPSPLPLPPFR